MVAQSTLAEVTNDKHAHKKQCQHMTYSCREEHRAAPDCMSTGVVANTPQTWST